MLSRILGRVTGQLRELPILVLMPHSRCNCRCVMCDIWKANHDKKEISPELVQQHVHYFKTLGVREVIFSGGEALMHSNLWKVCSVFRENNMRLTLLSTGLLLERNASEITANFKEVIVSLDGSQPVHDKIRNIPQGFEKISAGVAELKKQMPGYRITARCVLQRHNFMDFIQTVGAAKTLGLAQISFLAADISSAAFNRSEPWSNDRVSEVALNKQETNEFEDIIRRTFRELNHEYRTRFIAESPKKMLRIVQYYKAVNGMGEFPRTSCNAPWVSAVIESDGRVMPCFFHKPYGNIFDKNFIEILNAPESIDFRRNLQVDKDPICKKCVCSLNLGIR